MRYGSFGIRCACGMTIGLLLSVTGCSGNRAETASPNPTIAATPGEVTNRNLVFPTAQPTPLAVAPTTPDAQTTATVEQYLKRLAAQGYAQTAQGVWMQTGDTLLANHQGTTPLSAASLTKVATSLAALQTFGADYRFETIVGTTGTIENGVLNGDLIVQGNGDPFFVWEEAIAVGNALNQLGVKQISGDVIVSGQFYMNFEGDLAKSGALFKQALNAKTWSSEAIDQYQTLPPGTPKPTIVVTGSIKQLSNLPPTFKPLLRHRSLPLAELLKKMNRYSNNTMAEIIASTVGGAKMVSFKAAQASGVPQSEILLINGSGLAEENRISPRAVCSMFLAIERYLKPMNLTIGDVFTIVGQDTGVLDGRKLPPRMVTKSGTLDAVSALAGALPTSRKGVVWFVIMNGGGTNLDGFRASQESLLNTLANQWGTVPQSPTELAANRDRTYLKSLIEKVN